MPAVQFVVEGGRPLSGSIRPSGNKNAALPIVAAALISEKLVHLENVPRIRDIETLVELIRSVGASVEWVGQNALDVHSTRLFAPRSAHPSCWRRLSWPGAGMLRSLRPVVTSSDGGAWTRTFSRSSSWAHSSRTAK